MKQEKGLSLYVIMYNFTLGIVVMAINELGKVIPLFSRYPLMLAMSLVAYGLMTILIISILFTDYIFLTKYTLRKKDET